MNKLIKCLSLMQSFNASNADLVTRSTHYPSTLTDIYFPPQSSGKTFTRTFVHLLELFSLSLISFDTFTCFDSLNKFFVLYFFCRSFSSSSLAFATGCASVCLVCGEAELKRPCAVVTLLSLALLRNNYFKMSSKALSKVVYNFEIFIVLLLRQIFVDYRMILH